jgi:hypothetical protein
VVLTKEEAMRSKAGRPPGRKQYKAIEVYITPEHEATIAEAKEHARRLDRSLSRYICMAVAHFNAVVRNREAKP